MYSTRYPRPYSRLKSAVLRIIISHHNLLFFFYILCIIPYISDRFFIYPLRISYFFRKVLNLCVRRLIFAAQRAVDFNMDPAPVATAGRCPKRQFLSFIFFIYISFINHIAPDILKKSFFQFIREKLRSRFFADSLDLFIEGKVSESGIFMHLQHLSIDWWQKFIQANFISIFFISSLFYKFLSHRIQKFSQFLILSLLFILFFFHFLYFFILP